MPRSVVTKTRPVEQIGRPSVLEYKSFQVHQVKVLDPATGVVEALVAVTNNTDDGGDVILPGAFKFKRTPKVVWSHNLEELIGKVLQYEELLPGDARLPADLVAKGLGALLFRMQFDLQDPDSFKAYRKVVFHEDLGWSIGYEVDPKGFKMLPDGRRILSTIYVWEGSPTTFGMNQEARTMNVKTALTTALSDLEIPDERKTSIIDLVAILAAQDETEPGSEREEKAWPPIKGSLEDVEALVREEVQDWGETAYQARSAENDWYACIEGTFPDSVVVTFRFYNGQNEDVTYQFPYSMPEDDSVVLGTPVEVEIETTVEVVTPGTPAAEPAPAPEGMEGMSLDDIVAEAKAGRVLSDANHRKLQAAMTALQAVLAAANGKGEDDEATKDEDGKKTRTLKTKAAVIPEAPSDAVQVDALGLLEMMAGAS